MNASPKIGGWVAHGFMDPLVGARGLVLARVTPPPFSEISWGGRFARIFHACEVHKPNPSNPPSFGCLSESAHRMLMTHPTSARPTGKFEGLELNDRLAQESRDTSLHSCARGPVPFCQGNAINL